MKQLLQRLDNGVTTVADVPIPTASSHDLLIETRATVVSAGTERMLVEFGRAGMLEKARKQPEKVKQVLEKMRSDGFGSTLEAVRAKLDAPIPLGYCHAGVVVQTGPKVREFKKGDRVVSNGRHAEYVRVPHTLAATIPENVSDEAAAFTPLAAIGLQGVRLAEPTLGETVVVFGLGLIGLLTVQLLRANGCRVVGIDRDSARLGIAARFGAIPVDGSAGDPAGKILALTGGMGADAVLLTLSATSDEPIHQAAKMSRKRGRVVLVGVTGLTLRREDFYEKELSFTVSCSYGPGRYDPTYEEEGQDYPLPFVRWTEKRNFMAVLGLMATGQVDPLPLVTHRFDFEEAPAAYDLISGSEASLGVVLTYPGRQGQAPPHSKRTIELEPRHAPPALHVAGLVGAGNFAVRTLLPVLKAAGVRLQTIVSDTGASGAIAGRKFGFARATTDVAVAMDDPDLDTVYVLTRHDSHAALAIRALRAGKNVFVEKPLALTEEDLDSIEAAAVAADRLLMVGFNRRFAPLTVRASNYLRGRSGPLAVIATVNAGAIPLHHWTQDPAVGGGRIVGEASHWLDLARALVLAPISDVAVIAARDVNGRAIDDIAHLSVAFADGSTAVVHYLANGSKSFPKERIECFWDGKTVVIENWRRLKRFGVGGPWLDLGSQIDKGHAAEIEAWNTAIRNGGPAPIPLPELIEVSRWSIRAAKLARDA